MILKLASSISIALMLGGLPQQKAGFVLERYESFNDSPRLNLPSEYINHLKATRFQHGELDNLPKNAIVLYADVAQMLGEIGFTKEEIGAPLKLGTSDPTVLFVIRPKKGSPFMLEQGLPGAGGITTQAAELITLGARTIVHIGTCAVLGNFADSNDVILAQGSYKDGAGVLLSSGPPNQIASIAYPGENATGQLRAALQHDGVQVVSGIGFTSPVYYFESSGLYTDLLTGPWKPRPNYIEMEQGPFFELARRMGASAASMVVAGDRYRVVSGKLTHDFLNDEKRAAALRVAFAAALQSFK